MFLRLRARAPLAAAGLFALLLPAPAGAAEPVAPLVDASARGDLTAVRALIGKKVDVNAPRIDGMTALHAAVHADRLDIVGRAAACRRERDGRRSLRRHAALSRGRQRQRRR